MSSEPILVVDDNPTNLKLVRVILSLAGYDVITATNAAEAFSSLRRFRPRLVLMDLQLPDADGLEVTQRLKAAPETRDTIVVALSAYAMKSDEERALAAGCDGYIRKPVDTKSLASEVAAYLTSNTRRKAHENGGQDPRR